MPSFFLLLAAGFAVYAALHVRVQKTFRNPIAYTMAGDSFYVLEKERNTILQFDNCAFRAPLKLNGVYRVELDDARFYYMARKLFSGPNGIVVHSYIYDRKTRGFVGYRFQEYGSFRDTPRILLTVFLKDPSVFPEFKYACDGQGNHYFVNNCVGGRNIWKMDAAAENVIVDRGAVPADIRELGDQNEAMSGWPSVCLGPDGRIYVSCATSERIVEYAPDGRRLREIGSVGINEGELLAPEEVFFVAFMPGSDPCLTVANAANRSWVQFDPAGAVTRILSPLQAGYPYLDILVGCVYAPHAPASPAPDPSGVRLCSFDLVNKCFVILGRRATVISSYRAWEVGRTCRLGGIVVLLLLLAANWRRLRVFLARIKIPFFMKLLALFIPLLVISLLIVGDWVRDVMQVNLEAESIRRSSNLAHAILNSVAAADLEAICNSQDRGGVAYERVYQTVSRIVDSEHVEQTPKWIIHKIRDGRFYFGINIWRGQIYEPFIVPYERHMFFRVLRDKTAQAGRFADEQGEWFSVLNPITNAVGAVTYVLELYRPTEEIDRAHRDAVRQVLKIAGLTSLAAILLVFLFSYAFTRPLRQLMLAAARLGRGDFEHPIVVRSRDELRDLAGAFNRMMLDLKRHIADLARSTAEKERVQTELRFAREVQQGIVPKVFPPFPEAPNVEIVARMEPAREVGGDYFDFFMIDPDHMGVVIADVSDKGVPAGLFTMIVRTLLRVNAKDNLSAASAVSRMNRQIAADNPSSMFVTLFYFVADLRTGEITFCSAGHPLPFRLGRAGVERVQAAEGRGSCVIAGIYDQVEYSEGQLILAEGETLVLYTDGVTEPIDKAEQMYGEERLRRVLGENLRLPNRRLCDGVVADVMEHQKGIEQFDDITLLFFKFLGTRSAALVSPTPTPPAPAAQADPIQLEPASALPEATAAQTPVVSPAATFPSESAAPASDKEEPVAKPAADLFGYVPICDKTDGVPGATGQSGQGEGVRKKSRRRGQAPSAQAEGELWLRGFGPPV